MLDRKGGGMNLHVSQLFPPARKRNRFRLTPEQRMARMLPGIFLGGAVAWGIAYVVTTAILRA